MLAGAGWSRPWAMFVEIEDREEEERGDPGLVLQKVASEGS